LGKKVIDYQVFNPPEKGITKDETGNIEMGMGGTQIARNG
jgi:hypothetical protein